MSKLKKAWEYIRRHKYLITILAFLLIIGVLDEENSLIQRFSHWREIRTLNTEIEHYRKQYERDSRELTERTDFQSGGTGKSCPRKVSDEERKRGYLYF